jgi:hypothetical protein
LRKIAIVFDDQNRFLARQNICPIVVERKFHRRRLRNLARLLFESTEDDAPPPGAHGRALAALGVGSAIAASTSAAAAATAQKGGTVVTGVAIAKWILAGEVPAPLLKSGPASTSRKSSRTMSAAARARIAAAARRRWKKAKAAGKNRL